MKILFLGDVVGLSGCSKITDNLSVQIKKNSIDFLLIWVDVGAYFGIPSQFKIHQKPIS